MILALKNKLKHLALLDSIIEPEWEYRYYSYNAKWGEGEEMSSLRDSCGGEWFILFFDNKVAFKCTSPEDGLVDDFASLKASVPNEYSTFISEPAFSMDSGSCIWYLNDDEWVKLGLNIKDLPDPESIQSMTANDYCQFAEDIFEKEVAINLVQSVFDGNFTIDIAKQINPEVDINTLKNEWIEMGIKTGVRTQ